MKLLSVIIPVYNEEATVCRVIDDVEAMDLPDGFISELIVINDGSVDRSADVIKSCSSRYGNIRTISHDRNRGKSVSVREGILASKGDLVVIQDADLEYEPGDIVRMLREAVGKELDFVYGNRFCEGNEPRYFRYYWGNRFVSLVSNIFTYPRFGRAIPDMEVCYKLIRGEIAREIAGDLRSETRFGVEAEVTARLSRYVKKGKHLSFAVVPIAYRPRTIEEGKKIRWNDGVQAVYEIMKYNLTEVRKRGSGKVRK